MNKPMKKITVNDILARKQELLKSLKIINEELVLAKKDVLGQIETFITELDIQFCDIKDIYDRLNLSTAVVQVIPPNKPPKKAGRPGNPNARKNYRYYNTANGKWFNGYQKPPVWFDFEKADSYLVAGAKHTPLVLKELEARGLDKSAVKEAYTEAELKVWKEHAEQMDKLFKSNQIVKLKVKAKGLGVDLPNVLSFCSAEVIDELS